MQRYNIISHKTKTFQKKAHRQVEARKAHEGNDAKPMSRVEVSHRPSKMSLIKENGTSLWFFQENDTTLQKYSPPDMDKRKQDIAYFVSFCIEQYKNAKGLTGAESMRQLDAYGNLDYLAEHYETLHT